jgi:hypothetical protein
VVWDHEVAGSNPVAPTSFQYKPFGQYVEGLSYCWTKSYAVQSKVQPDDFKNLPFRREIHASPALTETLRKFKRFDGEGGVFGPVKVGSLKLQTQLGGTVPQFGRQRSTGM